MTHGGNKHLFWTGPLKGFVVNPRNMCASRKSSGDVLQWGRLKQKTFRVRWKWDAASENMHPRVFYIVNYSNTNLRCLIDNKHSLENPNSRSRPDFDGCNYRRWLLFHQLKNGNILSNIMLLCCVKSAAAQKFLSSECVSLCRGPCCFLWAWVPLFPHTFSGSNKRPHIAGPS